MKKILIPLGTLLLSGLVHAQLSSTENYVYTKTYLDYNGNTPTKTSETVQYFDGLGRPKQVVNVKASPQGKDVVTHIEYDGFGRQVKDYLPVPQSQTLNGAIVPNPLSNVTNTPYGTEKIYAEKLLENSPLDRILLQTQVGNAWNDKPVKFYYNANSVNEVYKYVPTTIWENGATKTTLTLSVYEPNQLYKNTVLDEDGNNTTEFKNGQGQTVLVRKMLNDTEYADTYYVYNEYNQLAVVIPPKAVNQAITETLLNDLCYQYRYDGRNRLVEKKLPGKGWEYLVYDKADRLIMSQDANMKASLNWMFIKYDKFGRIAYTGISTTSLTRQALQTNANANTNMYESRSATTFTMNGMPIYYSNVTTPVNVGKVLTINYYDSYPGYTFNPAFPTTILQEPTLTDTPTTEGLSTKSLPVMSLVKNIEDDNWTKNYTYYDKKGRIIGTYSINHLGGYTKTESKLDFAGVALQTKTYHKRLSTDTEKVITENFEYDPQNRLKKHYHQVDSQPQELLAENTYNELSQLANKKVGNNLQSIDYTYNIRGWMTKINDPENLNGKLFGYEMKYQNPIDPVGTAHYNGNITEIDWSTQIDNTLRRYDYYYDELNRFNFAQYSKPNASVPQADSYNEWATYDLNGNIQSMGRYGLQDNNQAILMDHLKYTYLGNRLNTVSDISQNPSGYPLGGSIISYDDNGNMTNHLDKGISSIQYNFLNLPKQVISTQGNISFTYRADGNKMKKIFSTKTTDYLDGFQYENTVIKFLPTPEGYFNFENNKYIYNYTDHLGNIRISYLKNSAGSIEVLEENNYYAFGLKHEGYNALTGNPAYQYKYNGKELQENGMYDYGARFYMPDVGRWGVIDPLAEKMTRFSPYNYAFNNPLRFIDSDGRQGTDWVHNRETNQIYWNNNATSQATAGANETYLGKSGTYTTESGSTTALNSNGSYTNNSLLGGMGIMNNLDPLIQASDLAPQMSYAAFGDPNAPTVRETPASNSPEVAMGNPSGQLAVAGLYGLQGAAMEIGTSKALGVLAKVATTSDGFLFGGINMKAPFNIPTQRFGNIATDGRTQFWGLRIGESEFANRTLAAIKTEWNPLTQYTSGIIPKGTPIKVGIIGPQAGGFYTGGSLQFITNSNSVVNQATKIISR